MVKENKKGNVKNNFLIISSILILIGFVILVYSASSFSVSLVKGGNYTGTMFLNVTTDLNHTAYSYNITFFYNLSGGPVYKNVSTASPFFPTNTGNLTGVVWNQTTNGTESIFGNITIDAGVLSDGFIYNISGYIDNGTDQEYVSITNATYDNTPPQVNFSDTTSSLANNGYYKASDLTGELNINVSVADALDRAKWLNANFRNLTYVYINITNSTDQVNFTRAYNLSRVGVFYNMTIKLTNATLFPDGKYNITIWANDSMNDTLTNANNLNSSEYIQITLDRVAPSAVVLTSSSATTTQLVTTITITDATSGANTCSVPASENTAITGTGTNSQTLTHTGLSCETSYSYIVTCFDKAGNSKSSDSTSFSTSACSTGGSSSGGSSGSTTTWTQTFTVSDTQFKEGYNKKLGANKRAKLNVNGETHYVGVKSVTATSAMIEISSTPITVELSVGEDVKRDLNDNGFYDIYVKLNAIVNNQADLTINKINEKVPEEAKEEGVETSGEIISSAPDEVFEGGSSSLTWLWIVIGILVVAAVVVGIVFSNKNKDKDEKK